MGSVMRSLCRLIIYVALVLGGQSASLVFAASASHEQSVHHHTMDNSMGLSAHDQMADDHSATHDPTAACCGVDCDCASGHCASGVILLGAAEAPGSCTSSVQPNRYTFSINSFLPPLIFRPPIAA